MLRRLLLRVLCSKHTATAACRMLTLPDTVLLLHFLLQRMLGGLVLLWDRNSRVLRLWLLLLFLLLLLWLFLLLLLCMRFLELWG
jgi:hypothetical protein